MQFWNEFNKFLISFEVSLWNIFNFAYNSIFEAVVNKLLKLFPLAQLVLHIVHYGNTS